MSEADEMAYYREYMEKLYPERYGLPPGPDSPSPPRKRSRIKVGSHRWKREMRLLNVDILPGTPTVMIVSSVWMTTSNCSPLTMMNWPSNEVSADD